MWLNRIRRGFNEIKQEVQQELHNDSVMQTLRETREQVKENAAAIGRDLHDTSGSLTTPPPETTKSSGQEKGSAEKPSE